MSKSGPKGFVLAAGFGTRLRPLTSHYPKPLIPWAGSSPLELALWRLKMAGLDQVAINAHHLPEQIREFVEKNPFQQALSLSYEPELLGTGGAYNPLRTWLQQSDLVVYNGDIVSDIDLDELIDLHENSGAVATMALLHDVLPGESAVWCVSAGESGTASARVGDQVLGFGRNAPVSIARKFGGLTARNFACAQVLSRRFFDYLPDNGSFDVISRGYQVALDAGELVVGHVHKGFWHDLRNPYFYFESLKELLMRDSLRDVTGLFAIHAQRHSQFRQLVQGKEVHQEFRAVGPVLHGLQAVIHPGAQIGPFVVIENDSEIGSKAKLNHCVVLAGGKVGDGEELHNEIVGRGFRVPIVGACNASD